MKKHHAIKLKRIEVHHFKQQYRELDFTLARFAYFRLVFGRHAFVVIIKRKEKNERF